VATSARTIEAAPDRIEFPLRAIRLRCSAEMEAVSDYGPKYSPISLHEMDVAGLQAAVQRAASSDTA